ncbi:MAG: MaoC family dehydratase [Zoogloeaceae bacterium]|jgi:Acyl dehydratase|nr:MaoC family dehydratase [Zoogloeaceae bacterium]
MSLSTVSADLQNNLGKVMHVGKWLTLTQERIDQFAAATGDFQWIHVDRARAQKESAYGDTIAHGYLLLALTPYLTGAVDAAKPAYPGMKSLVNYGSNKVRFIQAVAPGRRIRARTTLLSVEEINGALQVARQISVEIEGESKPACVAEVLSRIFF